MTVWILLRPCGLMRDEGVWLKEVSLVHLQVAERSDILKDYCAWPHVSPQDGNVVRKKQGCRNWTLSTPQLMRRERREKLRYCGAEWTVAKPNYAKESIRTEQRDKEQRLQDESVLQTTVPLKSVLTEWLIRRTPPVSKDVHQKKRGTTSLKKIWT